MTKQVQEDVVKNLFNKKYTKKQIIATLASLEKTKPRFVGLIKKYQPSYYIPFDDSVASFTLLSDLNLLYPELKGRYVGRKIILKNRKGRS